MADAFNTQQCDLPQLARVSPLPYLVNAQMPAQLQAIPDCLNGIPAIPTPIADIPCPDLMFRTTTQITAPGTQPGLTTRLLRQVQVDAYCELACQLQIQLQLHSPQLTCPQIAVSTSTTQLHPLAPPALFARQALPGNPPHSLGGRRSRPGCFHPRFLRIGWLSGAHLH